MTILLSSVMKNKSKNMCKGPRIQPCGTPKIISSHSLYDEFIVLRFLLDKLFCFRFKASTVNPYAFSFAIRSSWSRQSSAFDRSVSKAPKVLPFVSRPFPHFKHH